jgi:D-glycero-alpha-D-manno-heptose-7-phosphate kinase
MVPARPENSDHNMGPIQYRPLPHGRLAVSERPRERPMYVEAIAPARIDLAGGTLDIYPLYLFEEGGITVNIGIDVSSRVRLTPRADRSVRIRSVDTGLEQSARSAEELELGGPLDLVARLLRFYPPATGVDVETENRAPKGSGLGASSSLLIALSGALNALNETDLDGETIIRYGADLEAQNIRIPTGKQDYYAAFYGGVNAIHWGIRQNEVRKLLVSEEYLSALERRLILTFTGISHFSGATNWDMLRNYIENTGSTRRSMRIINETAHEMAAVLQDADLEGFARVLDREWQNRRSLAEGVSTPEIDAMMAAARSAGALAGKLCGAGGGGCMITFVQEGAQDAVKKALVDCGARLIPYRISRSGLQVRTVTEDE